MVTVWFGVGQFLPGAIGQLYPGGDNGIRRQRENSCYNIKFFVLNS